ncbi:DUF3168 domain-containing protein [Sediminispirochaeta smaragdinae]|uniref:Phage protein n=1 Tax=Sediminispirochaeta smaragdinae (strain DSM 11293 / JCM 15392 / SEBR 4228) TaxID=573413 RepID=E1R1H4_SEDSS|nr:DUF3168 domain-containing protein [Sediminispirochaeta smaragdinae]ADK81115.1 hypothetical protein Spirs_1993 [Sediminispirochaeta smaragdinae DSM 11293]
MSRAPEVEITEQLRADTALMERIKAIYDTESRVLLKIPYLVVSLVSDTNEKVYLSYYGGSAAIQIDIYAKDERSSDLRALVKDAVRRIRGVSGALKFSSVVVTGDAFLGIAPNGLYRWMVEIRADYTEEGER